MRHDFGVPISFFGIALTGAAIGYFTSGLAAGTATQALGLGKLLSYSCGLVAVAMCGIALSNHWAWLCVWPVIWGLGSGGIDAALNQYAAAHFPPRHVNWLHACYSLGAAIGPVQMTAALVLLSSWRLGYACVALIMLLMMFAFLWTQSRFSDTDSAPIADSSTPSTAANPASSSVSLWYILSLPRVWLQLVMFYFYTGLEALIGQWSFTWLTQSRALDAAAAGICVGVYFAAIAIGRIVSGIMTERVGVERWLRWSLWAVGISAIALQIPIKGIANGVGLAAIGFAIAPVFPCLIWETPRRLGQHLSQHVVGAQIAFAVLGASSIPVFIGICLPQTGPEFVIRMAFIVSAVLIALHNGLAYLIKRPLALQET